jgi:hypothetical protein
MQHIHDLFVMDLPMRADQRLREGLYPLQFLDNFVPWHDPRAICRICYALHVDAIHLENEVLCPFALGAGLCPNCNMAYGAGAECISCVEYREHFQVLASVVSWHARINSKEDFSAVLKHLFCVSDAAVLLILDATTARLLPSNNTIMFRSHARLQVGSVAGVNAVSRGADLSRYLAFARSVQSLDPNPNFGLLWDVFLQSIAGRTLTLVNPRPCVFGPLLPAVADVIHINAAPPTSGCECSCSR